MMMRKVLFAGLAALLATPTAAMPLLRADVEVVGAIVTVGDMFTDAGALAATPIFRAPAVGTAGLVPLATVRAAAARIGLDDFSAGLLEQVRVVRPAASIDGAMLCDLLAQQLRNEGRIVADAKAECRFAEPVMLKAEAVSEPVRVLELNYQPGSGGFAARLSVAGTELPVDLRGAMGLTVDVPHLAATLKAGAVLTEADIEMKRVRLEFAGATGIGGIEQLIGKALNRNSRAGLMLRASDVSEPLVIVRSAVVPVVLRNGPMVLTVMGQALNGAAVGQPVAVLNATTKKILHGTATASGGVEIILGQTAVAGL